MITKMTQIKLSLPIEIKKFARKKANKYGLTLAGYIRYLLINEIRGNEKEYVASERVEKAVSNALENKDKWVAVDNVKEFFGKL